MSAFTVTYLFTAYILNVDSLNWVQVTDNAPWSNRSSFTAVTYKDSMVISGGYTDTNKAGFVTDVWNSSIDGSKWTQDTSSTGMTNRTAMTTVLLNDNIITMGGCNGPNIRYNDVWSSSDGGYTWKQVTSSAAWSTRCCHASIAYNGSVFVLGGHDMNDYKNDVWRSDDNGSTWHLVTDNAGWSKRDALGVVVFNNTIFVMGGHDGSKGSAQWHNDVWSSNDGGKTWIEITGNAEWQRRSAQAVVVWNNNIIIMGGWSNEILLNDVWSSNDSGKTWTQINTKNVWSPRWWFPATVLNGNIFVLGGDTNSIPAMGDIWVLTD